MSAPQPTSAAEWRARARGELLTLPSGQVARIRPRPNVYGLLRDGTIDQTLLDVYVRSQAGQLTPEDLAVALELQDVLLGRMFVEPLVHVGDGDPPDGAIAIDDLDDEDIEFVLERAFGGAPAAAGFPEQSGGGDAGDDSGDVEHPAKPAARAAGGKPARVPDGPAPRRARPAAKPKSRRRAAPAG